MSITAEILNSFLEIDLIKLSKYNYSLQHVKKDIELEEHNLEILNNFANNVIQFKARNKNA